MISIVSGLPRSRTSLMMQMLVAGGMQPPSDGERKADTGNLRGYLEWGRIKQRPNHPACIVEAEGKVVKVITRLLLAVPPGHEYRVTFMQRPLSVVPASQDAMMRRRGTYKEGTKTAVLSDAFEKHLKEVYSCLESKPYVKSLRVPYREVLSKRSSAKLIDFLGTQLNLEAMRAQVDDSLDRHRAG